MYLPTSFLAGVFCGINIKYLQEPFPDIANILRTASNPLGILRQSYLNSQFFNSIPADSWVLKMPLFSKLKIKAVLHES